MTRQTIKLIAAAFAVAVTLSLASIVGAEKGSGGRSPFEQPSGGGKQPAECARAVVSLSADAAAPGEEIFSGAAVTNCAKDQTMITVQQIQTDSCGNLQSMSTDTFRLRRDETIQTNGVRFLTPGPDCGNDVTITVRVTGQTGNLLTTTSAHLTITPALDSAL